MVNDKKTCQICNHISAKLEQLDMNEIFKEYVKSKTGEAADETLVALFNEIRNLGEDAENTGLMN
ncbi:MAG: hypothetical protein R2798_05900 [Chitinophagales bacterium]|nr:hypothetical protein [Bacteroidota bacterium]